MSQLQDLSSNQTLRQYALGAAQEAIQPVADFLAPMVDVQTMTGHYKSYTEKHRFHVPSTQRANGGRATEISFDVADLTYNCAPHALDYPVDLIEKNEAAALEDLVKEGAVAIAEIAALAHEKAVIEAALEALGAGTNKTWNSAADPVSDLDDYILQVVKAAKYGSLMGVGVLFGAAAWRIFKNHATVRSRFVVGNPKAKATATPTEQDSGALFIANPEVRASYMIYDDAPEGVAADIKFLLDSTIIVFARKKQPTRRDPSFMKTFRCSQKWMVPRVYQRDDGRVEVAGFDWSEDVKVTNTTAGVRLNIAES